MLPSEATSFLAQLRGHAVAKVTRQVLINDRDIPDFEQEADGPIELTLDNHQTIYFDGNTERQSVDISPTPMPKFGSSYITIRPNNDFWRSRMGFRIEKIYLLKSRFGSESSPGEFGILFQLENGRSFLVEYVDSGPQSDTLRIADHYSGPEAFQTEIS